MAELEKREALQARPPPAIDLTAAFKKFFAARSKSKEPLEDRQLLLATKVLLHLLQYHEDSRTDSAPQNRGPGSEYLQMAMNTLKNGPGRSSKPEDICRFADALYQEIKRQREAAPDNLSVSNLFFSETIPGYVEVLSRYGRPLDGRQALVDCWQEHHEQIGVHPWKHVLQGLAMLQDQDGLRETVKVLDELGILFSAEMRNSVVQTLAKTDNLTFTKEWFDKFLAEYDATSLDTKLDILRQCIRHKDFERGQPILDGLLEEGLEKRSWDMVFLWAAAKGKGIEEIARMMDVMVRREQEKDNPVFPDIETFNGLIRMASENNDSYRAEQYLALAQRRGMELNAETLLMQCDYRLKVGDIDGARYAYKRLQQHEVPLEKDSAILNRLIVTLSDNAAQNYDAIMLYVEEIVDKKGTFEPPTVAVLAQIHLDRQEEFDLIDLFETHVYQYGTADRNVIIDVMMRFCLDRSIQTARVWNAYEVLREVFPELPNDKRLQLMESFFARKRSDMSLHVFGHIRQREVKKLRPDAEAYIRCFEGLGTIRDLESLQLVHNMLKLDAEVEPDTRLLNALMLAYISCGEPRRAMNFWEDIVYSREGPTYSSIQIALHGCELEIFGDRRARGIWARLQRYGVVPTREIYAAYVGALAGHGQAKEAISLVKDTKKVLNMEPDTLM